ncbi:hypothetical protein [Bradyrhizobium oligotrophicum]|uniref:hypothetical protein n=1 Tax=Bradyrhizobium oligotrophicum TaxID=44255 RepID=UPI003EB878EF
MAKPGQRTEGSHTPSLEEALSRQQQRASCDVFVGEVLPDRNFANHLLIVSSPETFYSVNIEDILERERIGATERVWVRNGSAVWRCTSSAERKGHGLALGLDFSMENMPPPAPRLLVGGPQAGTAVDQQRLTSGTTIEGAAKLFADSCEGGDRYANNCAHFLSDAFIHAGFSELRSANSCINARCDTSAKRPIRARDMWCWFKSKASQSGGAVARDTGIWAVFQLKESEYWGGHVTIIDSNTWKYYGTGWYNDWDQYSYKW